MLEQKQFENSREVEQNLTVELVKPFLEKVDQKAVVPAKIFLTK